MSLSNHFATLAIHVGSEPDPVTGAVVTPISLATTFAQKGLGSNINKHSFLFLKILYLLGNKNGSDNPNSFGKGFEYARTGNPTRGAFERAMAAVEYGAHCVAFG